MDIGGVILIGRGDGEATGDQLAIGRLPRGSGTGFVWDASGLVVTNHHVFGEDGGHHFGVMTTDGGQGPSDHANFYNAGIPVLFFFTGTHSDYHRPTDHAEKINVEGMQSIGELVADVGYALAGGMAIPYTEPKSGDGFSNGLPGSNPETVVKRVKKRPVVTPAE